MFRSPTLVALAVMLATAACDLVDPARPIPHPDTELFGNLIETQPMADRPDAWSAQLKIGMPKAFLRAEQQEGRPTPAVESGVVAQVLVTRDTVVLVAGRCGLLEEVNPGTELAVIPVAGTTRMTGTTILTVEAAYLADFASYRRWRLPGLTLPGDVESERSDSSRINSDGTEHAPLPLAGGRVVYFAARLRPPPRPDGAWVGARRSGLAEPAAGGAAVERPFRAELGGAGWSAPEPVLFDGVDDATDVRVSWVSEDETRCLVSVREASRWWLGAAARSSTRSPWGAVARVEPMAGIEARDGVYLAGSSSKIVFATRRGPEAPSDLWLYDPTAEQSPLPLPPTVNTATAEWGPRVGPANELFFVRGDRQLLLAGQELHELVAPGPHRMVVTEAAPTDDGAWVFFCTPNYRPIELDDDIWVAAWLGGGRLGGPVPVDDWRP